MVRSIISGIFTAIVVVLALALCGVGLLVGTNHMHLQPVLTGSMRPLIQPGDLAVTWAVPTSALKVGDVVAFYPPNKTEAVIHRIQTVTRKGGATVITTKGDANNVADAWHARLEGNTAYRLAIVVPKAGFVPVWSSQIGRGTILMALGVLVAVVAVLELLKPEPKATNATATAGQTVVQA